MVGCFRIDGIEVFVLGPEFNIYVKTLTNKSVALTVREHEPVSSLMERIQDKVGIPSQAQSLVYNGRQLEWGRLLSTYGVGRDANVVRSTLSVNFFGSKSRPAGKK